MNAPDPRTDPLGFLRALYDASLGFPREVYIDYDANFIGYELDVRLTADQSEPMPEVFILPRDTYWPLLRFALRTRGDAASLAPAVRQVVRRLDAS